MRFHHRQHLRKTFEFDVVRREGKRRECGAFLLHLLVFDADAREAVRRLGVVASKRVGGAVQRNRAKRRMRTWFREFQALLPENCDVIMTARKAIELTDEATCRKRFLATLHQLTGVITPKEEVES